ncbi:MAG: tryptophan synthase subunit alpha, partial [Phycisphaerae bacterium]
MDPNNRLNDRLRATRTAGHGALLPYFTAGFPDPDTAAALIRRADHLGVAVVEIGFPYADSIADGPVIQASFHHALTHGYRLRDAFALAETVRPSVACGLVAMVSFSIVHRVGVDAFMAQAASAGFDGVILPDLPIDEADASATVAHRAGLCHIGLVAPTTPPERGV